MCQPSPSHPRSNLNFLLYPYYNSKDAIALVAIAAFVVRFTDLSGSLVTDSVPWTIVLWLTGINPWTISRAWQVMISMIFRFRRPTTSPGPGTTKTKGGNLHIQQQQQQQGGGGMSQKQQRFIWHELIHTITGFYHFFPLQGLVWMAMINFPLWFAHLDLCMSEKERKNVPPGSVDRFNKQSPQVAVVADHDPLVVFSLVIYVFGAFFRGQSFLLSGAGVVIMSLPFTRRKADFSVAVTVPPLVMLFLLEHYTIMNEMDTWHNVVHSLSHMVLHVAVNNLFKHHVAA